MTGVLVFFSSSFSFFSFFSHAFLFFYFYFAHSILALLVGPVRWRGGEGGSGSMRDETIRMDRVGKAGRQV
ncbi:hypothetical protein BZA05DRAFT_399154 [Tricharina praecox]|uniref:uncharacterized protein n=1 Tax=Tricharina praecox TaxID=43433 RepID=UPI002220D322|nr:uncharacterized protein BZA05DRAFT_399154 [Tricharina praecox]KAI5850905.1 hypothetical protein BZA05DRAFT_399154 [Tricharina praecox]